LWISSRAGSFITIEVALEIFEHPKPKFFVVDRFSPKSIRFDASFEIPCGEEKVTIIMSAKLYVGNLSFDTTTEDLEKMFGASGTVQSTNIIEDRDTGRSRGFAFVEMSNDEEAQNAITALNGKEIDGRALLVNEAKPRENRGGSGGGGGRGGYGGGGNRGGGGGGRY
jgi:RNA recognition motif-containing protein